MQTLFEIKGRVRKGKGRGKGFGFPTANISVEQTLPEGIFVSRVTFDGHPYNALTFIGTAKTFDETEFQAESYLLDFDDDLYGREIEIKLLKKLRDNKRFASEQELINQMKKDVEDGLNFFRSL